MDNVNRSGASTPPQPTGTSPRGEIAPVATRAIQTEASDQLKRRESTGSAPRSRLRVPPQLDPKNLEPSLRGDGDPNELIDNGTGEKEPIVAVAIGLLTQLHNEFNATNNAATVARMASLEESVFMLISDRKFRLNNIPDGDVRDHVIRRMHFAAEAGYSAEVTRRPAAC